MSPTAEERRQKHDENAEKVQATADRDKEQKEKQKSAVEDSGFKDGDIVKYTAPSDGDTDQKPPIVGKLWGLTAAEIIDPETGEKSEGAVYGQLTYLDQRNDVHTMTIPVEGVEVLFSPEGDNVTPFEEERPDIAPLGVESQIEMRQRFLRMKRESEKEPMGSEADEESARGAREGGASGPAGTGVGATTGQGSDEAPTRGGGSSQGSLSERLSRATRERK